MEINFLVPLLLGCCLGSILIFGLFYMLFGAVRKFLLWVFNGIEVFFNDFFELTDGIVSEVSNSINSLTDQQKREITNLALTSLRTAAALALYMQEDEPGKSNKASDMIIDGVAENSSNTSLSEEFPTSDKTVEIKDLAKSETPTHKGQAKKQRFGEQGRVNVFLCHSKEDLHIARKFRNTLVQYDYDVWLDDSNLLPGHMWEIEIQNAVRLSDIFLVCLSSSWIKRSGYIQKEIRIAFEEAKKKPEGAIYIVPTRLENCDVPESFKSIHYIDLFKNSKENFKKLIDTLDLVKITKMQYQ